jgi:hypothetical protein
MLMLAADYFHAILCASARARCVQVRGAQARACAARRAAAAARRLRYHSFRLIDSVFSLDVFDAASFFAAMILLRRHARSVPRRLLFCYCRAQARRARRAARSALRCAQRAMRSNGAICQIKRRSARVRVMPMPDAFHLRHIDFPFYFLLRYAIRYL